VRLGELEYPAETAAFWDAFLVTAGGACAASAFMIAPQHHGVVNVAWADGHAKAVKTLRSGATCPGLDGKPRDHSTVSDAGPYQGRHTLTGIPFRKGDGSWEVR
jgi:prepilin-type processing-associated H-X9-DG protein